jgi:hypothetical protein
MSNQPALWTPDIRTLCQKNKGSVEIIQRPIKMSKGTYFQTGIDGWSHLSKMPRRRLIRHTYCMWLWGYTSFKISSPGPVLHGIKWLLWRPHKWSPTVYSKCGIKGLIKGKAQQIRNGRGAGSDCGPPLIHTYIHTYIHLVHTVKEVLTQAARLLTYISSFQFI